MSKIELILITDEVINAYFTKLKNKKGDLMKKPVKKAAVKKTVIKKKK